MASEKDDSLPKTMSSWQLLAYDGTLHFNENTTVPKITDDHEVLIRIIASSMNNLDLLMSDGYGHVMLNRIKKIQHFRSEVPATEFPTILGRDFVGEVTATGKKVDPQYSKGKLVMGMNIPPSDGSHAEYMVINEKYMLVKPDNVTAAEAVSFMYAGMTAWCALCFWGGLGYRSREDKKVLVIGAAGGVGNIAVQMLKVWGSTVVATCSTDSIPLVEKLKPDEVVDYTKSNYFDELEKLGPYNIVLDAAGVNPADIPKFTAFLKPFSFSKYVTLIPPTLHNTDNYGVTLGLMKTLYDFVATNICQSSVIRTSTISYGTVFGKRNGLLELAEMIKNNELIPVIDSVYSYEKIPEAYEKSRKGHLRGKIVIMHDEKYK